MTARKRSTAWTVAWPGPTGKSRTRAGRRAARRRRPVLRALAQHGDERAGLLDGDERVVGAVEHEERRGVRADVAHRRRLLPARAVVGERRLEDLLGEEVLHVGAAGAVPVDEVVDAVERDGGGDGVSASSKPGWKSARSGVSAASDDRWPPAEPPVMTMKSGRRRSSAMFAFVQASARFTSTMWSGHVALRRQPVVGGDADPAPLGEVGHQRLALAFLHAHHPGPAVDLEEHGRLGVGRQVGSASRRRGGCASRRRRRRRRGPR